MTAVAVVVLAGLGTFGIRLSAIALLGRLGMPSPRIEAVLRLIGPAVLASLVATQLMAGSESTEVAWTWWVAAVPTAGVAWRWRSPGLAIAVGIAAVWILELLA